jgi:hypothetical protein
MQKARAIENLLIADQRIRIPASPPSPSLHSVAGGSARFGSARALAPLGASGTESL